MADSDFLLRDNLSDTGQVPSTDSAFESPDLIVHGQVADPAKSFGTAENWDKDLCEPLDIASEANLIYVRVKNMGTNPAVAYVRVYSCRGSLFLEPAGWVDHRLFTPDNSPVASIGPIQPGGIGVSSKPFVFKAKDNEDYCHVGVVSAKRDEPTFPTSFVGFTEYVEWLHKTPNIGMRNFKFVSKTSSHAETVGVFCNPLDHETTMVFTAKLTKPFPVGTTVVLRCEQQRINSTFNVTAQGETEFSIQTKVSAYAEGIATAELFLPRGASAPTEGGLTLSLSVLRPTLGCSILEEGARYLKVGECTTCFY